jgi:predicted permease
MGLGRFRRSALTRELRDELAFHLEARTQQLVGAGISRDEAERRARAQYGELASTEREIQRFAQRRHVRISTAHFFETMINDLRFALRTMLRQPGWVIVAIIALALGIGANTAVFSVVNDLLIDPLRYPHADRLILITRANLKSGVTITPSRKLLDAWLHTQSLEAIEGTAGDDATVSGDGDPRTVHVTNISPTFLSFAGARLVTGRTFRREEAEGDGAPVVLLDESYWRARYNASKDILSRTITIDGKPLTIVGVVADGVRVSSFSSDQQTDLYRPLAASIASLGGPVVARLKPGVTMMTTQAELQALSDAVDKAQGSIGGTSFTIAVVKPGAYGSTRNTIVLLGGAVIMLLLIACANVAHLLIARGAAREREIAVRAALGAGRGRIMRQLLTESLLLAGAGCIAGLAVGYLGVHLIVAMRPSSMADLANVRVDARVVLVTVGISLLTGIVFGMFSALDNARGNFTALRAANDASTSRRRHRVRAILVVSEMALSVVLLVGATLLIRTMINLYGVDPGFDMHDLYSVEIHLPQSRYPKEDDRHAYTRRFIDAIQRVPELRDFTIASAAPTHSGVIIGEWEVEGQAKTAEPGAPFTFFTTVRPGYFELMRMPLAFGNAFDWPAHKENTVINASLARQLWGTTNVVGRRFRIRDRSQKAATPAKSPVGTTPAPTAPEWNTVVGVVNDPATVTLGGVDRERPALYQPSELGGGYSGFALLVRAHGAFPATALRQIQLSLDVSLPPTTPVAVNDLLMKTIATQRFVMTLLTVFAGIAIALSAIGLYGVIAYMVSQRTREIGIRIALGAEGADIRRLVLSRGVMLAAVGLVVGLLGAIATTRALRESLYGVTPSDPLSFAIGAGALLVIAVVACAVPARKASKVDPAVAMRAD